MEMSISPTVKLDDCVSVIHEVRKTVIMDLADITELFTVRLAKFEKEIFGKSMTDMEPKVALSIIQALLDDIINYRLKWAKKSTHVKTVLRESVPWYNLEALKYRNAKKRFETEVIDSVECILINIVNDHIVSGTWDIWTSRKIGADIFLIQGCDYRVYDWERRMREGEWSL